MAGDGSRGAMLVAGIDCGQPTDPILTSRVTRGPAIVDGWRGLERGTGGSCGLGAGVTKGGPVE